MNIAGVPSRNARIVAVICQLWCWLGPLLVVAWVVRLTSARRDPFLRAVTAEVLNLQIVLLPYLVATAAAVAGPNLLVVLMYVVWIPLALYGYATGAIGAFAAWKGRAWRYPINLHLVRPPP